MSHPDPVSFLPLSPPDFHILVALNRAPLHGYAIMKAVEDASEGRVRIEVGSLYRMIGKLLSRGLIKKVPNPDDNPRPGQPRQSYALSQVGSAVLRAEAQRLRDSVALARAENLLAEGEGA